MRWRIRSRIIPGMPINPIITAVITFKPICRPQKDPTILNKASKSPPITVLPKNLKIIFIGTYRSFARIYNTSTPKKKAII
jgi:hypothetical protein